MSLLIILVFLGTATERKDVIPMSAAACAVAAHAINAESMKTQPRGRRAWCMEDKR